VNLALTTITETTKTELEERDVRRLMLLSSIAGALAISGPLQAHDLPGLVAERTSLDPQTRAKFEQIDELRRLLATQSKATQDDQLDRT
jgi:hypothetical protein